MLIGAPVPGTKKVGDRCRRTGEHKRSGENANEGARWEGHLLTSECAPEGAEGMGVGSGRQRSPTPLVLGHRGPDQLRCPAAGRISTPPHRAGGNRTTGGQCPLGDLPHVSRQEGGGGHGAGGPTERCQVPWEASMAPAVSWKSRSCCRKRMACVGEKMGPRRPRAGLGGQTSSHYALPATIPGQGQGRGSASDGGLHTSRFMLRVWLSGKDIVCWGC